MAALPPERSTGSSTACSSRTTRKHAFQSQKRNPVGEIRIRQRVFLVGRAGVIRPQGPGLSFRDFLGNGFELRDAGSPSKESTFWSIFYLAGVKRNLNYQGFYIQAGGSIIK
jgi:hypothetical protein